MNTLITAGIEVTVESFYQEQQSHPKDGHYFFAYRITIRNNSDVTVQLKERHWFIFDSSNQRSEVIGEGVVGETPVLAPGEEFQYVSGCNLGTDIGKMHGSYTLERVMDGLRFKVKIPEFFLEAPYKLN